jgi:hypothetical protein
MDGRTLKFLNVIDEYSQVCLAIRVGRRRTAVDLSSLPYALQEWCTGNG